MKSAGPDHEHFRGRMRDEARLLGMLQDEQVLGVSELVTVEGRDAVIMEFVEGVDLSEVVRAGKVPPRALAELGAEVAGTLHRAHSAKHPQTQAPLRVIHRDIKPANIMLTSRGGVRVLDFGVARAAFASRESQTQGLVLGTLNYFPPEILAGQEPTPSVDIYGLGLTLWECATGQEWGAPRVQKGQFEKRVDQRIAALGSDCAPLVPVLRQVLQWDPELRPDGGGLERMLLAAAEQCPGTGLRVWSREAIPRLLQGRVVKKADDPLVGRTVDIDGANQAEPDTDPDDAVTQKGRSPAADMWRSYDDFGPPAAATRAPDKAVVAERSRSAPKPRAKRPPARRGPPIVLIVAVLLVGAMVFGLLLVAAVVVAVIVATG